MIDAQKPLRVLVSEGSSTSGREAITILGAAGHHVEVCDPSRWCLARYSRFVRKFHHCPGLRTDPAGFLRFVERLLASQHFDVLLPTHEQGLLFARAAARLKPRTGLALPDFASYRLVHSKAGFSRLLDQLGLPQPPTRIVTSLDRLRDAVRFPCVIKTSIGTASRGVWIVRDAGDLNLAVYDIETSRDLGGELLVQDLVAGTTEKAQSVFCQGALLGFHAYRQVAAGIGGGEAIKESVSRPAIRAYLETIGMHLNWHGALSVDVMMPLDSAIPLLIDCNPRLVEPMNAHRAGVDLVDLLLRVSRGETPAPLAEGRAGVRTHLAMQALLGSASRDGTRRDIIRECGRIAGGKGPYRDSTEELTPVRLDWLGAVPLAMTAALLLASPRIATRLARGGFGAHLLDAASIKAIESQDFG
jgi:predicted ATP-grasp superfamily ATP-dependent carboligase